MRSFAGPRFVAAVLMAAALGSATVRAADEDGEYTVLGAPGLAVCTTWLEVEPDDSVVAEQIKAWVGGFLSSYNLYVHEGKSVIDGRTPDELLTWANRFCQANPGATMAVLAESMIIELQKARAE